MHSNESAYRKSGRIGLEQAQYHMLILLSWLIISKTYVIKSSSIKLHCNSKTHGCKGLVECKNGSVDWVPLNNLKQSNPVELNEYAMAN